MRGGHIQQQNREMLAEQGAGAGWQQHPSTARCLLPHLDGVSALLLGLGVCPAALVLVGLLEGLLVVVTVLIICGDRAWLRVGRHRHEEGHKAAQGSTKLQTGPA